VRTDDVSVIEMTAASVHAEAGTARTMALLVTGRGLMRATLALNLEEDHAVETVRSAWTSRHVDGSQTAMSGR
jgi:hypothetical protein